MRRLIVDLDNGPENHSRRTQFLYRMVQFAQKHRLIVQLAYYPPYHSKYNPIERCWGILEGYWRGEILDSEEAVLGYARSMTYNGNHPRVHRVVAGVCQGCGTHSQPNEAPGNPGRSIARTGEVVRGDPTSQSGPVHSLSIPHRHSTHGSPSAARHS